MYTKHTHRNTHIHINTYNSARCPQGFSTSRAESRYVHYCAFPPSSPPERNRPPRRGHPADSTARIFSEKRTDGTSLASNEFFFSGSSGTKFAERARNARGFRPTVPARSVPAARCASYKKKKLKLQSQSQCLKCVLRCANPVIERELSRAQTDCNANVERCLTETKVQARHPGGPGGGAAPTDIRRPEETRGGTIC